MSRSLYKIPPKQHHTYRELKIELYWYDDDDDENDVDVDDNSCGNNNCGLHFTFLLAKSVYRKCFYCYPILINTMVTLIIHYELSMFIMDKVWISFFLFLHNSTYDTSLETIRRIEIITKIMYMYHKEIFCIEPPAESL